MYNEGNKLYCIDDDLYMFHQTPAELCKKLIDLTPFDIGDSVLEPFKGTGSFYNAFPEHVKKDWCEIREGKDYKDFKGTIDWVCSNPPFKLENDVTNKKENVFYKLLLHFTQICNKGIAFLGNDYCLSSLTAPRIKELNSRGFYIHNIIVCSIKKWRGRYFYIILKKQPNNFFTFIEGSY